MDTKRWMLPSDLRERCWAFASQAVADYKNGLWPESRRYSTHGAESNELLWAESKMAECVFCLWADLDPLQSVRWERGPDEHWDVVYRKLRIDVKHTRHGQFLLYPFNKAERYEAKQFDSFVLITGTEQNGFLGPHGWISKQAFSEKHRVAVLMLHPDDWYMRIDELEPMPTLGRAGFVGYDKDGHFLHYCHCGKEAGFGYGVSQLRGKLGTWYCADHLPVPEPPKPVPERTPPPPPPPPAQGELF